MFTHPGNGLAYTAVPANEEVGQAARLMRRHVRSVPVPAYVAQHHQNDAN